MGTFGLRGLFDGMGSIPALHDLFKPL